MKQTQAPFTYAIRIISRESDQDIVNKCLFTHAALDRRVHVLVRCAHTKGPWSGLEPAAAAVRTEPQYM